MRTHSKGVKRAVVLFAAFCFLSASDAFAQRSRHSWKPSQFSGARSNQSGNHGGSGHNHGGGGYYSGHGHHGNHNHGYGGYGGYYGGGYSNYGYGFGFGYPSYSGGYYSSSFGYNLPYGGSLTYGTISPFSPYQTYLAPNATVVVPQVVAPQVPLNVNENRNLIDWGNQLDRKQQVQPVPKPPERSTAAEKLRSQQEQMKGDTAFENHNMLTALRYYKAAANEAEDHGSPLFRIAAAYAAMGKFDTAIQYVKQMLQVDPNWPQSGDNISTLYGPSNTLARNSFLVRLSRWVEADVRDPDRLLLMGTFLFADDPDQASVFLESSATLAGTDRYVAPFLRPVEQVSQPAPDLDQVVPEPPAPGKEIPAEPSVPPAPEFTLPQIPVPPEEPKPETVKPFEPSDLGFVAPRHGGGYLPIVRANVPPAAPALVGPELPLLGN